MECIPPKGTPEPIVTWYHGDQSLDQNDKNYQIRSEASSNNLSGIVSTLIIMKLQMKHAGAYSCRAENIANVRSSDTKILRVLDVPRHGFAYNYLRGKISF